MSWKEVISDLVSDAEMSFGFISGTGLGSVLLAIVIIVFLLRIKPDARWMVELLKSLGTKKLGSEKQEDAKKAVPPPAE